jgi:predicted DNA-binding mobile mystery protein A
MAARSLEFQQLNGKMKSYSLLQGIPVPPTGWVKALRFALGMSAEQLGRKLGVTRQAVMDIEKREREGAVTVKALKEVAKALDMQFVYGFVPLDGSLENLIDRKAREMATEIVMRTSVSMQLEGQENSKERIEKAIHERSSSIKNEMPKSLWD